MFSYRAVMTHVFPLFCGALGSVTVCSCVAAVEALFVDQVDGLCSGAVEQLPFVVGVFVLHL